MGDFAEVLYKGGPVALILAVGFAVFYIGQGIQSARKSRREDDAQPLTDSATANAVMRDTLAAVAKERDTAVAEARELRQANDDLHEKMGKLRDSYEAQLFTVRQQVSELLAQVDQLNERLHAEFD